MGSGTNLNTIDVLGLLLFPTGPGDFSRPLTSGDLSGPLSTDEVVSG